MAFGYLEASRLAGQPGGSEMRWYWPTDAWMPGEDCDEEDEPGSDPDRDGCDA